MEPFSRGAYSARLAESEADIEACQRLRHLAFIAARQTADAPTQGDARDADDLDEACVHVMVEDRRDGVLVCCFRMTSLASGADIERSYSARYYDLSALRDYPGPMVEMGRFCIRPGRGEADVIRVAWGAMTRFVDENGVQMLFGCSSFSGVDAELYEDAFALLRARHLAPGRWLPRAKAPRTFPFASLLRPRRPDMKAALKRMPPLLRTYLVMGGWVSDHAVVDDELNTLHVFTGLEISAVPPARARLLRGV